MVAVMDENINENARTVHESLAAVSAERDRWEPLIANACYGWLGERVREEEIVAGLARSVGSAAQSELDRRKRESENGSHRSEDAHPVGLA